MNIYATVDGAVIRLQIWTEKMRMCQTANLTSTEAEQLIGFLQSAIASLPRIGSAADLGCEVLP